jgi:hypothetical protein
MPASPRTAPLVGNVPLSQTQELGTVGQLSLRRLLAPPVPEQTVAFSTNFETLHSRL